MGRLIAIRERIALIGQHPPIAAMLRSDSRFQDWSESRERLGDHQDNFGLGLRMQLNPERSVKDFNWSNSAARFVRVFTLELFTGALAIDALEDLEELVENAAAWLMAGLSPVDGEPLEAIEDVVIHAIVPRGVDPERSPVKDEDSEEWIAAIEVVVDYSVSHAAMKTGAEAP